MLHKCKSLSEGHVLIPSDFLQFVYFIEQNFHAVHSVKNSFKSPDDYTGYRFFYFSRFEVVQILLLRHGRSNF